MAGHSGTLYRQVAVKKAIVAASMNVSHRHIKTSSFDFPEF